MRRPDLCLDPTAGSGTMAVACANLRRRFITIDREPKAVEVTMHRLSAETMKSVQVVDWERDHAIFAKEPMHWDNGSNFVVLGDSIEVMRSMPDGIIALIYSDPPFNAGREFRNKDGDGFTDQWHWDKAAAARLDELSRMDVSTGRYFDGATEDDRQRARAACVMQVEMCLIQKNKPLASYLSWMMLLLTECRRVLK